MAGNVNRQGIIAPQAAPTGSASIDELVQDYPELAEELSKTTGWRDYQTPDKRSRDFERQYPHMKPGVPHGG